MAETLSRSVPFEHLGEDFEPIFLTLAIAAVAARHAQPKVLFALVKPLPVLALAAQLHNQHGHLADAAGGAQYTVWTAVVVGLLLGVLGDIFLLVSILLKDVEALLRW